MVGNRKLTTMGTPAPSGSNSAFDGLEAQLWAAADALRNNMDAAEYTRRQTGEGNAECPGASRSALRRMGGCQLNCSPISSAEWRRALQDARLGSDSGPL